MRNWRKWRKGAAHRSALARIAANARWEQHRAALAAEPTRTIRVVELTVKDSHRPQRVIRMEADERETTWSRWLVIENGERVGRRRFGRTTIAEPIAQSLV